MSDTFNKAKRSEIMSKVHCKNTQPEIIVRQALHRMGYRFRLHRNDLPGKPDIVLPKYKTVVFVHGCFWHGCPECRHARIRPINNAEYWNQKLDRNIERDQQNEQELKKLGWNVLVVWECETKKKKIDALICKLNNAIQTQGVVGKDYSK